MKHQQVFFRPGGAVEVVAVETPDLNTGEVLIRPEFSYISAGTELVALHKLRAADPGQGSGFQPGYSQTGIVLAIGDGVSRVAVGDRVVATGAGAFHASRTVVGQNLVVPVPVGVDAAEAATAAMFCFAIEAVHKSRPRLGQKVAVFGAGMMGQLAARLYQLAGAEVAVADGLQLRRDYLPAGVTAVGLDSAGWDRLAGWARPYGIEHGCVAFGGDATDTVERLKPLLPIAPDGVPHGRIVFPGGAHIRLLMASAMGNIELLSSAKAGPGYRDPAWEHGHDYPQAYVPYPARRNVEFMLDLLAAGRLELTGLITHRYRLDEAPRAYREVAEHAGDMLGAVLTYTAGSSTTKGRSA